MMNMNDGKEVFISSTFHTSYRHRGNCSAVFTELNMEHMRISRVCVCVWYTWLCTILAQMRVPLRICVYLCMSIKNERPARANERWRETVIETLGRAGDGSGGGQQMEKTHSLYSFIFIADQAACFPKRHSWRGECFLSLPFSSHISCCAVTLQNTQSGPMSDWHKKPNFDLHETDSFSFPFETSVWNWCTPVGVHPHHPHLNTFSLWTVDHMLCWVKTS